jgi:hypothetical protein
VGVRYYNSSVEASEKHVATFPEYPLLAGPPVSTSSLPRFSISLHFSLSITTPWKGTGGKERKK